MSDEQVLSQEITTIPDESAAPEEGSLPSHQEPINNLAGDKDLASTMRGWGYRQQQHFDQQEARVKFCGDAGTMDLADRMMRVALRKDTSGTQTQDTLSNVSSTAYMRAIRIISAGETQVFFNDDELPAVYVPEINTEEYTPPQGVEIAEQQNMLEQFTFDEDKRVDKIKELVWLTNKYSNYAAWEEWDRQEREITERRPTGLDDDGKPVGYTFDRVKRLVKDCPSLNLLDPKDLWADASIPDMQMQRCIVHRFQTTYEQLVADQEAGKIKNVGMLNTSNLYSGEDEDVLNTRTTNAGESGIVDKNGLFVGYHVWGMVPIREYKRKGKGKWDPEKTPCTRYWATFIGEIGTDAAVCVRLIKNPRHDGRVPYKMFHSHRDDKGLYHDGFPQMVKSLYWQACTNINQAIDNITLINQAPWIIDGELRTKIGRFRANKIAKVSRGTRFTQAEVRDASQGTSAMYDRIERDIERTTGADKPILGEALGSRTSATEAKQVMDQALMPLDDKSGYMADQLFPWLLEMDAADWRQNGDPDTVVTITRSNDLRDLVAVAPTELWGPIRTKVTAVSRFRNNVQRRSELNVFLQNGYPLAKEYMDDEGNREFWRDTFNVFGFDRANEYFPDNAGYESRQAALAALQRIVVGGQQVEPDPAVNHRVWLSVFKPFMREYELLPERDENVLAQLRMQVTAHENMAAQQAQDAQARIQQAQGGGEEGLPGEIVGNRMEAEAGAVANV